METITFSKRLYSIPAILIFLALNVSYSLQGIRHVQADGSPEGLAWMTFGSIVFTVMGTLGWRYFLNRRSARLMRIYLASQTLLLVALFVLENADTHTGSAIGSLSVTPIIQSAVLGWWMRSIVYGVAVGSMILFSAVYLPVDRIVFPSLILMMTQAAVLLLGHLIVSEERIRLLLDESNRKLTEHAAQVEELATAKERNRLAREIHDSIGHYLTAVHMQIEAARAILRSNPELAEESLVKAQTLTKEGLAQVRLSVSALRANPIQTRPLHEAIELLVEEHRASGLDLGYQVQGVIRPVSAEVEITLYRIAQEALTNVRKHAQATHADLVLDYLDPQHVHLKINDNGRGSAAPSGGFGLVGIQERLRLLGGTLNIDPGLGQGFTLLAEIPT
jgi:signal transduction histidine kinase